MQTMKSSLEQALQSVKARAEKASKTYRFDIFKGIETSDGKVQKLRSVGSAILVEGAKTYTVYLKSLLRDVFYLLPEEKKLTRGDYAILTREPSPVPTRKYFWNNIGESYLLSGQNAGLMRMSFDLFGAEDIYMNLSPVIPKAQLADIVSIGDTNAP